MKKDYTAEANRLAKAIDIAIDSFSKYPPAGWDTNHISHIVKVYSEWKHSALNPAPQYKKTVSLKCIIQDAFTLFQEGTGQAVEYFWEQVAEAELGYERIDKVRKILSRGNLKGRVEFDYAVDILIAAEQDGRITKEEVSRLSNMIGEFEKRRSK